MDSRKCRVLKHGGTEGTERGGKKQREEIGRGEKIQKGVPQAGFYARGLGKGSCSKLCGLCASVF
jgi:hypothetical protein